MDGYREHAELAVELAERDDFKAAQKHLYAAAEKVSNLELGEREAEWDKYVNPARKAVLAARKRRKKREAEKEMAYLNS